MRNTELMGLTAGLITVNPLGKLHIPGQDCHFLCVNGIRFMPSNKPMRYASAASCRAPIVIP